MENSKKSVDSDCAPQNSLPENNKKLPNLSSVSDQIPQENESNHSTSHAVEESTETPSDLSVHASSNEKSSLTAMPSEIVGAGLKNLGNTCFFNAVMQCFTHTVLLLIGIVTCDHKVPCIVQAAENFCLLCVLIEHVNCSFTSMGSYFYPSLLVKNLRYFSSNFVRFQQEDAHEFLQCFLDKLENCWNDLNSKSLLPGYSLEGGNIVNQIFGGYLVSKLKCCKCNNISDSYEPFVDVSLEIENGDNLFCALISFTSVEKINDTKINCDKCKEPVFVEKQLKLYKTPSVAIFHLKRFKNKGSSVEKIDKHVDFPLELDLSDYTVECQNPNVYDLYAVVVHKGSYDSGHYYSFICSSPDKWYKLDDDKVNPVLEEHVLSEEAYILFYAKRGTMSFLNFFEIVK